MVKWRRISLPKDMGGWGLKENHLFDKSFTTKSVWRLVIVRGLWIQVVTKKYIELDIVEDRLRIPSKSCNNASILWKSMVFSFRLICIWLVLSVGKCNKVMLDEYPWVGYGVNYRLSNNLVPNTEGERFL
jgi:hypothetical protein